MIWLKKVDLMPSSGTDPDMPLPPDPANPPAPFLPFTRPTLDDATIAGVAEVLRSGWITSGPQVKAFEARLSEYCGGRPVRAFNSGTCTMEIALRIAGIGPGDEVITTPLTWVSTSNVVLEVGARPVFVDIDPVTRNLDLSRVEAPSRRPLAPSFPWTSRACRWTADQLYEIADRHRLRVIEDAAQAFGSNWGGRPIGSFGDFVSFSFHANKNITTIEGGCLVLNDEGEAALAEQYRLQGVVRSGVDGMEVERVGGKFNLTDVAARVGIGQLPHLEAFTAKRRELARAYFEQFDRSRGHRARSRAAGRGFHPEQLAHVPGGIARGTPDDRPRRGDDPPAGRRHRLRRALPRHPSVQALPRAWASRTAIFRMRSTPGATSSPCRCFPTMTRGDVERVGHRPDRHSPRARETMSAEAVQSLGGHSRLTTRRRTCRLLFARLYPVLDRLGYSYEVIFTNDGSSDRSGELLAAQHAARPRVTRVIEFNTNYGQHMAIMAAFEHVRGEVIVTLDADLQNPPEEIPKLLEKIAAGHDYVGGYRLDRQDSFFRSLCVEADQLRRAGGRPTSR